jgi:zinc transport system ATP-binding protein
VSAPAIEVSDVWLSFDASPALCGVSLTVEPGEFLGVIGPNGAGKTALLKVLLGLVRPDRGTVRVLGLPVRRRADSSRTCRSTRASIAGSRRGSSTSS